MKNLHISSLLAMAGIAAGSNPLSSAERPPPFGMPPRDRRASPWGSSPRRGKRKPGTKARQRMKDKAARVARRLNRKD